MYDFFVILLDNQLSFMFKQESILNYIFFYYLFLIYTLVEDVSTYKSKDDIYFTYLSQNRKLPNPFKLFSY